MLVSKDFQRNFLLSNGYASSQWDDVEKCLWNYIDFNKEISQWNQPRMNNEQPVNSIMTNMSSRANRYKW